MVRYRKLKYADNNAFGMPEKGWKTLVVREDIYAKLKKKAEKEHRSVTNMAEVILLEATEK